MSMKLNQQAAYQMNIETLTHKVSAYQLSMIKISKQDLPNSTVNQDSHNKYQRWQLPDLIHQCGLTERQALTTWIGCEKNSHAYAILFCLLQGCLKPISKEKNYFLKLKYSLYSLAKKYLLLRQQKCLVQNLSFIEYTPDITKVLYKYEHLQKIFSIIFQKTIKQLKGGQESKLQQIKLFCRKISFCTFVLVQQNLSCLIIDENRFHIIYHRQCFFVVEYSAESSTESEGEITFSRKKNRVKTLPRQQYDEETYQKRFEDSNRMKTQSSKKKISMNTSSSKKLQYSTPRFIMRSIHTSNKNVSGGSDRQTNEIKVKSFNFSGEKDHETGTTLPRQLFSSFKKDRKKIPSIHNIVMANKQENSGVRRLGSFPISPKKGEDISVRSGFVYRSLGSDGSHGMQKDIKKEIFQKINLKNAVKKTENISEQVNDSPSHNNFISSNRISHNQIHLSPRNIINSSAVIEDKNLSRIFRNTKNCNNNSYSSINNPQKSLSPIQSIKNHKQKVRPRKIVFTYFPAPIPIRQFRSLSPHQFY